MASDDEHDDDAKGGRSGKSRRELPAGAVATLKAWMLSPEHFTHPYPTPQDQVMLMQKTGIDKKQLKNWFTNARRRIWKPMLKKQLEQGKLTQTGGGGVAVPGVVQGLMVPTSAAATGDHTQQQDSQPPTMPGQYQQPPGLQQQAYDYPPHPGAPPQSFQQSGFPPPPNVPGLPPQPQQQQPRQFAPASAPNTSVEHSNSIGSLTAAANVTSSPMNKTDSHAVLMELFARDQDLVRQATEGATTKTRPGAGASGGASSSQTQNQQQQPPQRSGSSKNMVNVPTLNSWPHFSSISSLNNLGSMTGVRSITSLSGADLSSQGNLTKMGSLAQMKSMESMSGGKNDSYAFLEVFFGDKSTGGSSANLNPNGKEPRGTKRDREEDNDIGLSLDEDQSPSTKLAAVGPLGMRSDAASANDSSLQPAPLPANQEKDGTLKRAYDDALAARGLISVSRSCEKLTDLALPVTMQRTLSQEYLRQHQAQQQQQQQPSSGQQQQQIPPPPQAAPPQPQTYGQFSSAFGVPVVSAPPAPPASAGPAQAG
mmetsp:Transcript_20095/g.31038  ORF Transcript_20095/g.31038 Transcript_20095/m.31038 type:complete len:538 (+) Transcript_20095:306-1919(+)